MLVEWGQQHGEAALNSGLGITNSLPILSAPDGGTIPHYLRLLPTGAMCVLSCLLLTALDVA
jgi:hypothetical protein